MFIIVCYDVEATRTQVYKKALQEFLERGQNSVFWGELPESKFKRMEKALKSIFEVGDEVHLFVSPNALNVMKCCLSKDDRGAARMDRDVGSRSSVVV